MPDGLNTYKSTLTGPELDEALRNIGNVQANIEKAAGYAETAEQYGTIVEQNQTAIQAIEDNLPAVQGAAANAQSAASNAQAAAQSAQKAQMAAQQALGFRTFFSAVSPDENGDLDPSRPMVTPTAQASWTIKSRGDRIQSVQVNGFTTQAGTGDPSPTNVREISTAGQWMLEIVLDGSSDEAWALVGTTSGQVPFFMIDGVLTGNTKIPTLYTSRYKPDKSLATTNSVQGASGWNEQLYIRDSSIATVASFKAALQKDPLYVWLIVSDASQATGLYIPIQVQGHEYRCKMLKLAEGLDAGDTVHTRVMSGCDAKLVFDGSADENWSEGELNGYFRYVIPVENIPATDSQNGKGFSNFLYLADSGGTGVAANKYCFTVASNGKLYIKTDGTQTLSQFKEFLSKKNLVVYLRSTAYTEANDLFVELETHANGHTYAHDPVTLVAVPYTDSDVTAANQLAATPSTLPYFDSADVPMLLNKTTEAEPAAESEPAAEAATETDAEGTTSTEVPPADATNAVQPMTMPAPLSTALPVAGTYVVSSQNGTTVQVSLKSMQDGGDAATLEGMTLDDIKALVSSMIADANK